MNRKQAADSRKNDTKNSTPLAACEELRQSLREYEDLFNKLNDAASLFEMSDNGLPGRYLEVNDALCKWLGYSRAELLAKTPLDISEKADNATNRQIADLFARMGRDVIERTLVAKDGRRIPVEVNFHRITHLGRPAVLSISRDVSDRKLSVTALREGDERFRSLVEQSLEGISLIDEKGIVIEWNSALESITGILRGAATGRTLWDVQEMMRLPEHRTPERLKKSESGILHSLRNPDSPYLGKLHEIVIYRPDGTPVNIQQIVFPIKTSTATRLASMIRDITEQKKANEALLKSELRFKTLIENAFEGITVIDGSGKVTYESPGIRRILGYSAEDEHGKGAFDNVHPDDLERSQETFGRCMMHPGEPFQMVLRVKHKNGTWRWLECVGKNLLDDPAINGIVINYRDATERKTAEEARQKFDQQIQQVEKLESLGILAGGIAHDFNNLLTGIFGFIDVARLYNASGAADKVSVNLTKALDVFNRARGLTQQLLTFSKGGLPVKKVLTLPQLLTNTANFVLSGSAVGARFSFPEDLWPCEVDENQIGQVIDNIVINARQAMPTGGALVITAENVPRGGPVPAPLGQGDYVKISIRDSGTGISSEHLSHIFDPFFTTKQEGSGLGLATAYSIVRKHDGLIEAESELGAGAVFHLYLPASPLARVEAPCTERKKHRGGGAVLVLDDEDFVRDVATELLKTMGYSVDTAASGGEAIEKYRAARGSPSAYKLCILDLTIPGGMGGKDVVQVLLSLDPAVTAIAASGYSQDQVMTDPQAFGFKDRLRKPFTKEELGEVLERVMGKLKS